MTAPSAGKCGGAHSRTELFEWREHDQCVPLICVTHSSSAARVKLTCRAAASKALSALSCGRSRCMTGASSVNPCQGLKAAVFIEPRPLVLRHRLSAADVRFHFVEGGVGPTV